MSQKALKWELDSVWSLDDLLTFSEFQDIQEASEREAYDKASNNG